MSENGLQPSLWDYDEHTLITTLEHLQKRLDDNIPDVLDNLAIEAHFFAYLIKEVVITPATRDRIKVRATTAEMGAALFDELKTVGHLRGFLKALKATRQSFIIENLGFNPEDFTILPQNEV